MPHTDADVSGGPGNDFLQGTSGDDTINGYAGNDTIEIGFPHTQTTYYYGPAGAGADTVHGGAGNDVIDATYSFTRQGADVYKGSAIDAGDRIAGGAGYDTLYTTPVNFSSHILTSIEKIVVENSGLAESLPNGQIFLDASNVAAGKTLVIDGHDASFAGHSGSHSYGLTISTNVLDSDLVLIGGGGPDSLSGGGGNDILIGGAGGDVLHGGDGDDVLSFTGDGAKVIDGGAGRDLLDLSDAAFSVNINLKISGPQNLHGARTQTISGIEDVNGGSGNDHIVGNGSSNYLSGGAGNDVLKGGNGADTLDGGRGADALYGGSQRDAFVFSSAAVSTGANHDTIFAFNGSADSFELAVSVRAMDEKVVHGAADEAHINVGLTDAIGAAQLRAHHAVLFTPDAGSLKGDTFLIIDANGVAGYQTGKDIVIELVNATHLGTLDAASFHHLGS
ncbi:MAG TPA: calcium-binding protein [Rhizomicrobium sp.]|nr:calcium-binding protein [Rhizomicrobium sp.]